METFTPEQRQALQNAHQQMVQAAAQQAQQAQQELTERVAALQLELDRARGARRTEAGMTGKTDPTEPHRRQLGGVQSEAEGVRGAALGAARARDGADGGAERRGSGRRGLRGRQR